MMRLLTLFLALITGVKSTVAFSSILAPCVSVLQRAPAGGEWNGRLNIIWDGCSKYAGGAELTG